MLEIQLYYFYFITDSFKISISLGILSAQIFECLFVLYYVRVDVIGGSCSVYPAMSMYVLLTLMCFHIKNKYSYIFKLHDSIC